MNHLAFGGGGGSARAFVSFFLCIFHNLAYVHSCAFLCILVLCISLQTSSKFFPCIMGKGKRVCGGGGGGGASSRPKEGGVLERGSKVKTVHETKIWVFFTQRTEKIPDLNPPPPLKAGTCFYFIACFYSLLAFIFTIHAFAMF